MRNYLFLSVTLILFLATACNRDDDMPVDITPPKLVIDIQETYVAPPSKVSVFFRVKDQNGNPVSGLTADNFTILERGRNDDSPKLISADEAERIIGDNEQVFDYKVMLLLDLSGSVINGDLAQLKEAAREFVIDVMQADASSSTRVGIWWFDGADVLHPLIDFTNNPVALQQSIESINPQMSNDNSTDLFGAVIKASELAKAEVTSSELQGFQAAASIIVFTDGTDQAARYSKEEAYAKIDNAGEKINYYTIGLGNEIDTDVLKRVGDNSSVFAEDPATLTAKFEEIAQLIFDETNSFYLFEYCTPKRDGSGVNDLIIEVEEGNRRGEKATNFDATGFQSGCVLY